MASITAGVMLMRWPLISAVLMFLASTLNIRFRKSDYTFLAVFFSVLGIAAACWFAAGLLGLSIDVPTIFDNAKNILIDIMNQPQPDWPVVMT